MKARSSQIRNLRAKSKWIHDVNSWFTRMGDEGNQEMLIKLGLDKLDIDAAKVERRLIVISRGWTRFAGQQPYEEGAVWVSWTKFQEALHRHSNAVAPLHTVYNELKETMDTFDRPRNAAPTSYGFKGLTIHLHVGELN